MCRGVNRGMHTQTHTHTDKYTFNVDTHILKQGNTGILYVQVHTNTLRGVVNICLEQVPVDLTSRVLSGLVRPAWVGVLLLGFTHAQTYTEGEPRKTLRGKARNNAINVMFGWKKEEQEDRKTSRPKERKSHLRARAETLKSLLHTADVIWRHSYHALAPHYDNAINPVERQVTIVVIPLLLPRLHVNAAVWLHRGAGVQPALLQRDNSKCVCRGCYFYAGMPDLIPSAHFLFFLCSTIISFPSYPILPARFN